MRNINLNIAILIAVIIPNYSFAGSKCNYSSMSLRDENGHPAQVLDIKECWAYIGMGGRLHPRKGCLTSAEIDNKLNKLEWAKPVGTTITTIKYNNNIYYVGDIVIDGSPSEAIEVWTNIDAMNKNISPKFQKFKDCSQPIKYCGERSFDIEATGWMDAVTAKKKFGEIYGKSFKSSHCVKGVDF